MAHQVSEPSLDANEIAKEGPQIHTDHTGVVAYLLRPPRSALQASDTPEQQVTLIDYVINVYPTSWSPSDNTAFPFETLSTSCELLGFSLPQVTR